LIVIDFESIHAVLDIVSLCFGFEIGEYLSRAVDVFLLHLGCG
jgi:hypothetical protein